MLHTKFQGHRLISSGEGLIFFKKLLTIYGSGAMLVVSPRSFEYYFVSQSPE